VILRPHNTWATFATRRWPGVSGMGDGWSWRLCEYLEPAVAEFERAAGCQFEVLQVKEKSGELRIHVNHANDAIRRRILAAEPGSLHTCDVCGPPGKRREGNWIKNLCEEHATDSGL
jgi:hypothetical protein